MRVKMHRSLGLSKKDREAGKPERLEGQTYDVGEKEGKALVKRGLAVEEPGSAPASPPASAPAPAASGKK